MARQSGARSTPIPCNPPHAGKAIVSLYFAQCMIDLLAMLHSSDGRQTPQQKSTLHFDHLPIQNTENIVEHLEAYGDFDV
jgi:hypothetical protein